MTLDDLDTALAGLPVFRARAETEAEPSIYAKVMGDRFDRLSPEVRAMHDVLRGGLAMRPAGWAFGPVPLPSRLAPSGVAREWSEGGRFHFDVPIRLPVVGLVVHYQGVLEPV